jgi:geranylgeranyl pyrophosphate synthase
LRAHLGQSLDVGIGIDGAAQSQVFEICLASLELKSGALMALAIKLGALVAGASPQRLAALDEFGHRFGIALQMFDDLGNLRPTPGVSAEQSKRFEDLYLRRPSWVWASAAKSFEDREYREFVEAVRRLPNESFLVPWLELHEFLPRAKKMAREWLEESLSLLTESLGENLAEDSALAEVLEDVRELAEKVAHAYE